MSEMIYCRGCGKQIHKTAPTCPSCGVAGDPAALRSLLQAKAEGGDPLARLAMGALQVTELNESGALRTQTAAGLWCLFLGQFGAHWFYLRRTVPGILSLLFFWTGIPGIIALVNGWQITFVDRQAWAKKYNNGISTPPAHWVLKVLVIAYPVLVIISVPYLI